MKDTFIFNQLTDEEVNTFVEKSHVFNMKKEDIVKEEVFLTSFEDETLGSSQEKLDVAISFNGGKFHLVNKDIGDNNYVPLSFVLEGLEYDKVMVIVRRMSSLILDKSKSGMSCYIYSVLHDDFKNCVIDKKIVGILAKNVVYLSKPVLKVIEDVKNNENISTSDKDEILNWLQTVKSEGIEDMSNLEKNSKNFTDSEEKTLKILGKNLRFIRRELLGITLYQMVSLTGISRDVLCRIEDMSRGLGDGKKAYPSIVTIIKLASGVGVKPSDLLDEDFSVSREFQEKIVEHCKNDLNIMGKKFVPI